MPWLFALPVVFVAVVRSSATITCFFHLTSSTLIVLGSALATDWSNVRCRYHPSIIGTHVTKELHFFDKQPVRTQTPMYQKQYFGSFPGVDTAADEPLAGRCSYAAHLGLSSSSRPALVRMEATAMYLAHPSAAGNVHQLLPQVRLACCEAAVHQPTCIAAAAHMLTA